MLKWVKVIGVCVTLTVFLVSCMHTVNGTTNYFPEGTDAHSCLKVLIVDVHGAPARAYDEKTRKKVQITVRDRQGRLLQHGEYTVEAGDVRWSSRDLEGGGLEVEFFEDSADETGQSEGGKRAQLLLLTYDGEDIVEHR